MQKWLNVDPLAEKYAKYTHYNFVMQNPIRLLDSDGRGVKKADDDYKVDKEGVVSLIKKTGDQFDRLFATDDQGNVDQSKSVKVNDQSILPQLENNSVATTNAAGHKDVLSIFLFGAENTNVEWTAVKGKDQGKAIYGIGTKHDPGYSTSAGGFGVPYQDIDVYLHSHPAPNGGFSGEPQTMYGDLGVADWYRSRNKGSVPFTTYVYMADSGRLWSIAPRENKISFIRQINGNPSRFIFGPIK